MPPPPINRILETALYVADLDASENFYRTVFAFTELLRDERMVSLAVPGRQVLLLFRRGGSVQPSPTPFGPIPAHDGQGTQHLCFSIDHAAVDAWSAHLAECGVALESRLDWSKGATSLYFRDPDGHSIEVGTTGLWQNDPIHRGLAMRTIGRRHVLAAMAALPAIARAAEADPWGFSFPSLDGGTLDFAALRGRVLLIVNTASFCGFAPQFNTLEALNRTRAAAGLTVIGMPSNDFDQEADSNAKVKQLCELTYGVDFPMASLTHVTGKQANPLYAWVRAQRGWEPSWNFNKVLIGRDGAIAALFRAPDEPEGKAVQAAINQALQRVS